MSEPQARTWSRDRARLLVPVFKALADENRLTLALLLAERPHTVKELQEAAGMSQALVSHHLTALREQHLVLANPQGRSNVYSLCCDQLAIPVQWLSAMASAADQAPSSCGDCGDGSCEDGGRGDG